MSRKKVNRAGILPYYIDGTEIKILFMKPKHEQRGGPSFQLIKGKVEEDESPQDAAIREAQEESGLFPPNIDGELYHLGKFLGRTDVFVCKIKDPDMFGDPTTPEEVETTQWMTPTEFQTVGRDLHKPVVRAAVRYINKHID